MSYAGRSVMLRRQLPLPWQSTAACARLLRWRGASRIGNDGDIGANGLRRPLHVSRVLQASETGEEGKSEDAPPQQLSEAQEKLQRMEHLRFKPANVKGYRPGSPPTIRRVRSDPEELVEIKPRIQARHEKRQEHMRTLQAETPEQRKVRHVVLGAKVAAMNISRRVQEENAKKGELPFRIRKYDYDVRADLPVEDDAAGTAHDGPAQPVERGERPFMIREQSVRDLPAEDDAESPHELSQSLEEASRAGARDACPRQRNLALEPEKAGEDHDTVDLRTAAQSEAVPASKVLPDSLKRQSAPITTVLLNTDDDVNTSDFKSTLSNLIYGLPVGRLERWTKKKEDRGGLLLLFTPKFVPLFTASKVAQEAEKQGEWSYRYLLTILRRLLPKQIYADLEWTMGIAIAVVDKLPSGSTAEGAEGMAWALVDDFKFDEQQASNADEGKTLSLELPTDEQEGLRIQIPLANTVFQSEGRFPNMLALFPDASFGVRRDGRYPYLGPSGRITGLTAVLRTEARVLETTEIRTPLLPLTAPRVVDAAMGNIVRTVRADFDIEEDATPFPASRELETAVNGLVAGGKLPQGPVSVWALVTPVGKQDGTSHLTIANFGVEAQNEGALANLQQKGRPATAAIKYPDLTPYLQNGSRLHRVMSGGGGWGKKAGLLSISPAVSFDTPEKATGEDGVTDEDGALLPPWMRTQASGDAGGSPVKEGDSIQFFLAISSPQPPRPGKSTTTTNADTADALSIHVGCIPSSVDAMPTTPTTTPSQRGTKKERRAATRYTVDKQRGKFTAIPGFLGVLSEKGFAIEEVVERRVGGMRVGGMRTMVDVPFAGVRVGRGKEADGKDVVEQHGEVLHRPEQPPADAAAEVQGGDTSGTTPKDLRIRGLDEMRAYRAKQQSQPSAPKALPTGNEEVLYQPAHAPADAVQVDADATSSSAPQDPLIRGLDEVRAYRSKQESRASTSKASKAPRAEPKHDKAPNKRLARARGKGEEIAINHAPPGRAVLRKVNTPYSTIEDAKDAEQPSEGSSKPVIRRFEVAPNLPQIPLEREMSLRRAVTDEYLAKRAKLASNPRTTLAAYRRLDAWRTSRILELFRRSEAEHGLLKKAGAGDSAAVEDKPAKDLKAHAMARHEFTRSKINKLRQQIEKTPPSGMRHRMKRALQHLQNSARNALEFEELLADSGEGVLQDVMAEAEVGMLEKRAALDRITQARFGEKPEDESRDLSILQQEYIKELRYVPRAHILREMEFLDRAIEEARLARRQATKAIRKSEMPEDKVASGEPMTAGEQQSRDNLKELDFPALSEEFLRLRNELLKREEMSDPSAKDRSATSQEIFDSFWRPLGFTRELVNMLHEYHALSPKLPNDALATFSSSYDSLRRLPFAELRAAAKRLPRLKELEFWRKWKLLRRMGDAVEAKAKLEFQEMVRQGAVLETMAARREALDDSVKMDAAPLSGDPHAKHDDLKLGRTFLRDKLFVVLGRALRVPFFGRNAHWLRQGLPRRTRLQMIMDENIHTVWLAVLQTTTRVNYRAGDSVAATILQKLAWQGDFGLNAKGARLNQAKPRFHIAFAEGDKHHLIKESEGYILRHAPDQRNPLLSDHQGRSLTMAERNPWEFLYRYFSGWSADGEFKLAEPRTQENNYKILLEGDVIRGQLAPIFEKMDKALAEHGDKPGLVEVDIGLEIREQFPELTRAQKYLDEDMGKDVKAGSSVRIRYGSFNPPVIRISAANENRRRGIIRKDGRPLWKSIRMVMPKKTFPAEMSPKLFLSEWQKAPNKFAFELMEKQLRGKVFQKIKERMESKEVQGSGQKKKADDEGEEGPDYDVIERTRERRMDRLGVRPPSVKRLDLDTLQWEQNFEKWEEEPPTEDETVEWGTGAVRMVNQYKDVPEHDAIRTLDLEEAQEHDEDEGERRNSPEPEAPAAPRWAEQVTGETLFKPEKLGRHTLKRRKQRAPRPVEGDETGRLSKVQVKKRPKTTDEQAADKEKLRESILKLLGRL